MSVYNKANSNEDEWNVISDEGGSKTYTLKHVAAQVGVGNITLVKSCSWVNKMFVFVLMFDRNYLCFGVTKTKLHLLYVCNLTRQC